MPDKFNINNPFLIPRPYSERNDRVFGVCNLSLRESENIQFYLDRGWGKTKANRISTHVTSSFPGGFLLFEGCV
jgi:hypothetical protein